MMSLHALQYTLTLLFNLLLLFFYTKGLVKNMMKKKKKNRTKNTKLPREVGYSFSGKTISYM